jgi:TonB family protein
MQRRNFVLAMALLLSQIAWADLTIRYKFEIKFSPAFPTAAADAAAQQLTGRSSDEMSTRARGGQCVLGSPGASTSIIDSATNEVHLLNPESKKFATLSASEYLDRMISAAMPASLASFASLSQNMRMDVQTKRTGEVAAIQGIQAEEYLETASIDISGQIPIQVRLEIYEWFATDEEMNRVPAYKSAAACAMALGTGADFPSIFLRMLDSVAGAKGKLSDAMKAFPDALGRPVLKMQIRAFAPAIVAMLQAQGHGASPAGTSLTMDTNAPLLEVGFNLAELSTDPLPEAVFHVPQGYRAASPEDLLAKTRATPAAASTPVAARAPIEDFNGTIYPAGNGVASPVPIYRPEPQYTEEARLAGIQGTVLVSVVVDEKGVARNVKVLRSLDPGLDQVAIDTVRQWKFTPGQKDGAPVAIEARVEVSFRLLDKPRQQ